MGSAKLTRENNLLDVDRLLDFKICSENTIFLFKYSIIKSIMSINELDLSIDKKGAKQASKPMFDYFQVHIYQQESSIDNAEAYLTEHHSGNQQIIQEKFTSIKEIWKHAFDEDGYLDMINNAVKATYYIIQEMAILKLNNYLTKNKLCLEDLHHRKEICEHPLYLPIEQDCSLSYFLYRYCKLPGFAPVDLKSFSKDEWYRYLTGIASDKKRDNVYSKERNDYYSHAKKVINRKSVFLKDPFIAGEDFLNSDEISMKRAIKFMYECDRNTGEFHKYVNSASTDTIPLLGRSALFSISSVIMGEIFKDVNIREIHLLQTKIMSGIFLLQNIYRHIRDIYERTHIYYLEILLDKYFSPELKKLVTAISTYNIIDNTPPVFKDNTRHLYLACSIILLKFRSFLHTETKTLLYINDNIKSITSNFPHIDRSYWYCMVDFKKKASEQNVNFNDDNFDVNLAEFIKTNLDINDEQVMDIHNRVVELFDILYDNKDRIALLRYLACFQMIYNSKHKKFQKFRFSNYYGRKKSHQKIYGYTAQRDYSLKSIIIDKRYTTETLYLIDKLIDAHTACIFGYDASECYELISSIMCDMNTLLFEQKHDWATSSLNYTLAAVATTNHLYEKVYTLYDQYCDAEKINKNTKIVNYFAI